MTLSEIGQGSPEETLGASHEAKTFDWLIAGLAKVHVSQQEHLLLIMVHRVHHE